MSALACVFLGSVVLDPVRVSFILVHCVHYWDSGESAEEVFQNLSGIYGPGPCMSAPSKGRCGWGGGGGGVTNRQIESCIPNM
jgi:hypothetical protein